MSGERARVAIDFFADVSCPWCYVGWATLKHAAAQRKAQFAIGVAWRTFMLSPELPPEGLDRKAYLTQRFAPEQLRGAHAAIEAAANAVGAPLNIDAAARIPNTVDAHRVIHWAANYGAAEGVIDALFHAYFVDGKDISARDVLVAAAESAGLDPQEIAAKLATDEDRALVLGFHAAAAKLGIQGVPVALFNRRVPVMGAQDEATYLGALEAAVA
ncbi:MAG: DsbA family oxidoreductase [Pseudomonadota bacterium]